MSAKFRSILVLVVSLVFAMSLWFVSAAVLADMTLEFGISRFAQAAMSSAVPLGFVVGALLSAIFGISDRCDPRRLFAWSVALASMSGFALLVVTPGGALSIVSRLVTGFGLAGVYPVGMKIAVGWGEADRGLLVGLLVGALTLGSASPHLVSLFGGAQWRSTVAVVSGLALGAALLVQFADLGPRHASASEFRVDAMREAWSDHRIRAAYFGYFGHMWELYAMWSWIGIAAMASYSASMPTSEATPFAKLTAFIAIGVGAVSCVVGGKIADKLGKSRVAVVSLVVSASCAIAAGLMFGGDPAWFFVVTVIWGVFIIPDSPQFSALVADAAAPHLTGSLLTLQTAIGFALTILVVQSVPFVVGIVGWPVTLAAMSLGPIVGLVAIFGSKR